MEAILFIVMLAVFVLCCFLFKLPVSLSMVLAAIAGTLIGGYGIPIRQLIEGTFSYIDTILIIATAMIFMKVIHENGTLDAINYAILKKFHNLPAILLILLMFIIMFPGMITGSSTASVLTSGAIVAPILLALGIPAVDTAAIIAIGGLLGMIAPPVNLPVMIIGGGIDMPYVGFELPLALLTFPLAIFSVLFLGLKHSKKLTKEEIDSKFSLKEKTSPILYTPILAVLILMILAKVVPNIFNLGMPLIFIVGAFLGMFVGKKINILKTSKEAIRTVLPVLSILMGVGMFIQIMTLTGVRGFIVINSLSLPKSMLYAAMAITIPLFGAVSSFGASSVLGVPFLLALIGNNQIITASAISLIASLGDLMPPTALAGIFAAQILGIDNYFLVLKKCIVPAIMFIVVAILFIVFSEPIARIIL